MLRKDDNLHIRYAICTQLVSYGQGYEFFNTIKCQWMLLKYTLFENNPQL